MRLCLDTSAYSHYKRGVEEIVDEIDRASWIGVPCVVLGELYTGFLLGTQPRKNEDDLREFMAHPVVHPLDVDDAAARLYAELVVELRKAGTPVPTNDIWIGAIAAREGAMVLTCDEHFRAMKRVGARVVRPTAS